MRSSLSKALSCLVFLLSVQSSVSAINTKQSVKAKRYENKRRVYLRNLKEENDELLKIARSLDARIKNLEDLLSKANPNTSSVEVQVCPEYSNMGVQTLQVGNGSLEVNSNKFNVEVQAYPEYSNMGVQPIGENSSHNDCKLIAAFSQNPAKNAEESLSSSSSEGEDQNDQVSNITTNTSNPNNNCVINNELMFLKGYSDNIQLGDIVGSVGAQFRTTQLNAIVLCSDKNPDDLDYINSIHYFTLVITGINGSEERPGSITYDKVTISGSYNGSLWSHDITNDRDLSDSLMLLVISAISYRPELKYLEEGLREVGVSTCCRL